MTFDEYRKGIDGKSWEDAKREREEFEYRKYFEEDLREGHNCEKEELQ